jgi:hypothetical protein
VIDHADRLAGGRRAWATTKARVRRRDTILGTADERAGHGLRAPFRAPTGFDATVLIGIGLLIFVGGDAFRL